MEHSSDSNTGKEKYHNTISTNWHDLDEEEAQLNLEALEAEESEENPYQVDFAEGELENAEGDEEGMTLL